MDLNGLSVAHSENIAQLERASAWHVVCAHEVRSYLSLYFQCTKGTHGCQHCCCATHVHFHHGVHTVTRLERNTTRVIHHAFTNKNYLASCCCRLVFQFHHARWLCAAGVYTNETATSHCNELIFVVHGGLKTRCFGNHHSMLCKLAGREVRRRSVCKVARGAHCSRCSNTHQHACLYFSSFFSRYQSDRRELRKTRFVVLQCNPTMKRKSDSFYDCLCWSF